MSMSMQSRNKQKDPKILAFIDAVQSNPFIWQENARNKITAQEKAEVWEQIAQDFGFLNVKMAQNKWTYLRGEFSRHIYWMRKYGQQRNSLTPWKYIDDLSFLVDGGRKDDQNQEIGEVIEMNESDSRTISKHPRNLRHRQQRRVISDNSNIKQGHLNNDINGTTRDESDANISYESVDSISHDNHEQGYSHAEYIGFNDNGNGEDDSLCEETLVANDQQQLSYKHLQTSPSIHRNLYCSSALSHIPTVYNSKHLQQEQSRSSVPITSRDQVTEMILSERVRRGLKWSDVAQQIGASKEWITSACLGQFPMTNIQAQLVAELFGLEEEAVKWLQIIPNRGGISSNSGPTDPTQYRFHEILSIYGQTLKELLHEEFGDGIMSAVDFRIKLNRTSENRVEIVWNGKFLPYGEF